MAINFTAILNRARQVSDDHMPDECTLKTRSVTLDAYGATAESYSTGDTVACRFTFVGRHPSFQERIRAAGIGVDEAYLLQVPHGTTLPQTGRVEFGGYDYAIVTEIAEPSFEVCAQALLQRIGAVVAAAAEYFLLEAGDFLLLETGDKLVLE
jgi:hypothetical protein